MIYDGARTWPETNMAIKYIIKRQQLNALSVCKVLFSPTIIFFFVGYISLSNVFYCSETNRITKSLSIAFLTLLAMCWPVNGDVPWDILI